MSTEKESVIAGLNPWGFWAHFGSLGMPDDIVAALNAGTATDAQRATAAAILDRAKSALIHAVPGVARLS